MHSHHHQHVIETPEGARRIVLAGNPNTGKSVFFNALTGMYVDVSNYPGTTIEVSAGRYGDDVVIDTPGVYGISSFNDEEMVARDVILGADVVVNIVNAVHLDRDLFLTLQIIDAGLPVVVALNMMDEARAQGLRIDVDRLSALLGVAVIPTIAVQKKGFEELKAAIPQARPGQPDPELAEALRSPSCAHMTRGEALLVLEGDSDIAGRHGVEPGTGRERIYLRRRERVNAIVAEVVRETGRGAAFGVTLGRLMVRPVTGIPILAAVLGAVYYLIGVIIAQTVVGFTEETVMQGYYAPFVQSLVGRLIPEGTALYTILVGEFGILSMTVVYILGLLLPLVAGFYLALSAMEDSGYLPRLATLMDRLLTMIGLNGRAVIPIILGFGCVTMATITTRLLGTQREKRIATVLLGITIPCSAQLGVIASLLAGVGPGVTLVYVAVIFGVFAVLGTALSRVLPGRSSDLLIDLPPLRLPRLDNVLQKTATKSYMFLSEATPLFALGALIIGILQVTGLLVSLQDTLAPLTVGWLRLPKEAATAFIMGFVRRDFGAAGLYDLALAPLQILVALVTITLFVPCIASVMVIFKERGWREGVAIWLGALVLAFLVGGTVARAAGL